MVHFPLHRWSRIPASGRRESGDALLKTVVPDVDGLDDLVNYFDETYVSTDNEWT